MRAACYATWRTCEHTEGDDDSGRETSDNGRPSYSPSGDQIAFAGGTSTALTSYDIDVDPAAGGTPKRLTTQANLDYVPTWRR